jgi:hypothetical protein
MKTTMRRSSEAMVIAIGVAMHAILPILPMIAICVLRSLKMKRMIRGRKGCVAAGEGAFQIASGVVCSAVSKQRIEVEALL